jgi:penicillin-binding protein 2
MEMAFGQGSTVVTPIEQAVAYSTFANGGTRYAPQVVAAIVSPKARWSSGSPPRSPARDLPAGHLLRPCCSGFEGVVNSPSGTAYTALQGFNFPGGLAGKTGTARQWTARSPPPGSWDSGRWPIPSTWWSA